jgi:methionine-gamma-lyase
LRDKGDTIDRKNRLFREREQTMSKRRKTDSVGKSTKAIHSGKTGYSSYGEVAPPIFQSATFAFSSAHEGAARFTGEDGGYIYTRLNNPTVNLLEENITALENGYRSLATASGMAAVTSVYLAFLDGRSHVVASQALYSSSRMALENEFSRFGVTATFVDTSKPGAVDKAIRSNTKLVYIETPTNPTMQITDIADAAEIAHHHGSRLVVDNTFCSPYLQRPLDHGADVTLHSCTKFINGHSDVIGGLIVTKDEKDYVRIRSVLTTFGGVMDPHQAWLILRGVRTLPLRLEKAQQNARRLAEFLDRHPKVTWVRYPGLPEHPQYEIARKQMDGFGAMLCFGVKNGLEGGETLMNNLHLITLAVSLGGVESLIEHPASMTHTSVPAEERRDAGIEDDLVRLSVGCEDLEDLREDLDHALNQIS